jgi:hypothetical protein
VYILLLARYPRTVSEKRGNPLGVGGRLKSLNPENMRSLNPEIMRYLNPENTRSLDPENWRR